MLDDSKQMASVLYHFPVTCLYLLTVAQEKEDPNDQYGYERLQRFGRLQRCATCPPIPSLISFVNMSAPEAQAAAAGHRAGNRNYSKDEVMNFLYVMKDILPIGPDEWQRVVDNHTLLYEGRDVDSIRRKFASLHRRQIPTGDPAMPEEVRLAKHVKYLIGDKANIGDVEDEFELERNSFNNEAEAEEQPVAPPVAPPVVPPPVAPAAAPVERPVQRLVPWTINSADANSSVCSKDKHTVKEMSV